MSRDLEAVKFFLQHGAETENDCYSVLEYLYMDHRELPTPPYHHDYLSILKILLTATDVQRSHDVIFKALCFTNERYTDIKSSDDIKTRHVPLLYAAGCPVTKRIIDNIAKYESVLPQFILDDQEPAFSLIGQCRKYIRSYLLSPDGGNHRNLLHPIPRLPGPQLLRNFLLFGVELLTKEKEDGDLDEKQKEESEH